MFRKLFNNTSCIYPQFRQLTIQCMLPSLRSCINSKISYTPKIQKIMFHNEQLIKYLAYLTRKRTITKLDMRQMTQNIISQYSHSYTKANLQNQEFGYQRNYHIKQLNDCPYHGHVDYMLYLNSQHFFPIMFFQNQLNPFAGAGMAMANMKMKQQLRNQLKTSGYSLITNGQQWVMFKIYRNLKMEKSILYEAKNNKLRNIYQDLQMISVVMGLIDHCLDINRPDVETLKLAYDFIDQQKFQLQAKQEEQIKTSIVSKLLTKYFQNKKDWNSK